VLLFRLFCNWYAPLSSFLPLSFKSSRRQFSFLCYLLRAFASGTFVTSRRRRMTCISPPFSLIIVFLVQALPFSLWIMLVQFPRVSAPVLSCKVRYRNLSLTNNTRQTFFFSGGWRVIGSVGIWPNFFSPLFLLGGIMNLWTSGFSPFRVKVDIIPPSFHFLAGFASLPSRK